MGSESSVTKAYLRIRGALARSVSGIVPPRDIEDIVQETYVRVCQADAKEPIRTPRTFMYRTVRNLALDHMKRAETRMSRSLEEMADGEPPAAGLADTTLNDVTTREEFAAFCEAVRQLPVQCRRVFVLKKVYGYSQKEIAADLGLSASTIEKHTAKGIRCCMQYMLSHGYTVPQITAGFREFRRDGGKCA